MKIYESTTLADYIAAEWASLDPALLRLLERTQSYIDELEENTEDWRANYEAVLDAANTFKGSVDDNVHDTYFSPEIRLEAIKNLVDDTDFEFV